MANKFGLFTFTFLFSLLSLVGVQLFFPGKVLADEATILGKIYTDGVANCPNNRYNYGNACGQSQCQGAPDFQVTWTQGANSRSTGSNSCFFGEPRYTFENLSNPQSDPQGKPVDFKFTLGNNATVNSWFHRLSNSAGNPCHVNTFGADGNGYVVGHFPSNASNQSVTITVYSEGDGCPTCQSDNIQRRGVMVKTNTRRHRFHCQDCGSWFSGAPL